MVEEVTDSDKDETVDKGLEEEHFVFGEVHLPYWPRFALNKPCELDHYRIDFEELVDALELVAHRSQPW